MPRKTHALTFGRLRGLLVVVAALLSVGCGKKEDRSGSVGVTSAKVSPAFTGKFPHRPTPDASPIRRAVAVKYVGPAPASDREDTRPVFALTNLTKERVKVGATWAFYYDASGKPIDNYGTSLWRTMELGPGETKQARMGRDPAPKDAKTVESEVSSAEIAGAMWNNDNLAGNRCGGRPLGGLDAKELEARSGERVTVDVYGIDAQRVRLTNVGDRPVKDLRVVFFRKDAEGNTFQPEVGPVLAKPLAPGEAVDASVEMPPYELERQGIVDVEARAPDVTFADGTRFRNANLAWPR